MIRAMRETVVLLHGFAGTGRGWDPVVARAATRERYTALAPDLRGHGVAARRAAGHVRRDRARTCSPPRRRASRSCGYSMGGRIALARRARRARARRAAGARRDDRRASRTRPSARRAAPPTTALADADRARTASRRSPTAGSRSRCSPATPPAAQQRARADIARNEPAGLAAALRGIGTGAMAPLWEPARRAHDAGRSCSPGERDAKFTAIGERLAAALPDAELVRRPGRRARAAARRAGRRSRGDQRR